MVCSVTTGSISAISSITRLRRSLGWPTGCPTVRATVQWRVLLMMRNGWQLARMALITCLGLGLYPAFGGGRFFINRNHVRGGRRCHDRILCLPRDLRDHSVREDHEGINNRFPPQSINMRGLLFGQRPGEVESEFLCLRRCHRIYCIYFSHLYKVACEI